MTDRTYSTTGTNNVTSDYEGYANPLPVYANNAVDKMTNENIYNKVHEANDAGQQLKAAWLQGVMDFGTKPETPAWQSSTVESTPPLTLNRTTTRNWGEPAYEAPYTDPRGRANPHSTSYYTFGKK